MRFSFFLIAVLALLSFNSESCTFSLDHILKPNSESVKKDSIIAVNYIHNIDTVTNYSYVSWDQEGTVKEDEIFLSHQIIRPYDQQVILTCTLPENWTISMDNRGMPVLTNTTGEVLVSDPFITTAYNSSQLRSDWEAYNKVVVERMGQEELTEIILGDLMRENGFELMSADFALQMGLNKTWSSKYVKKFKGLSSEIINTRWKHENGEQKAVFIRASVYAGTEIFYGYSVSVLSEGEGEFDKAIENISTALVQNLLSQEYTISYNDSYKQNENEF